MQNEAYFTVPAIGLGLTASALYQCFVQAGAQRSARDFLLLGFPGALLLSGCSALAAVLAQRSGMFEAQGIAARGVALLFFLWFGAELVRTVGQAQSVCRQQFSSGALLGVLPLLFLFSLGTGRTACNRTARMLWWLVLAGVVTSLVGLSGQMHWQRLAQEPLQGPMPPVVLYPEYFALPFLTESSRHKKAALLPGWVFGVQAVFAFGMELLFGSRRHAGYTGYEALRVWGVGVFSRLDSLLLLLWLAVALYRICFLLVVLRQLWARGKPAYCHRPKEGGVC